MIIKPHDNFSRLNGEELSEYYRVFGNILDAHANKWHLFTCSRDLARRIANLENISDRQRATAENVAQQFGQVSSLLEDAALTLVVYDPKKMNPPTGNNIISVSVETFYDPNRLVPVQILVEDSRYDKFVIDKILDALQVSGDLPQAPFKVRYRHCGGSGFPAVLNEVTDAEQMFVCVVDTDKKSAHSPNGDTLKSVNSHIQTYGTGKSPISIVITTPSREIENLIPPQVYEEVWANSPERHAKLACIKKIMPSWPSLTTEDKEIYLYYDFKNGFDCEEDWNCGNREEEAFKVRMLKTSGEKSICGLSQTLIQQIIFNIEKSSNAPRLNKKVSGMFQKSPLNKDVAEFASKIFSLSIHNPSLI